MKREIIEAIFTISGFSFSGSGQNAGMAFVALKDWDERKEKGLKIDLTPFQIVRP